MAKRSRKRSRSHRGLGQADIVPADSGTFDVPARKARIIGLSPAGKLIATLAGVGLLAWLFWPKSARAETTADKAIPTNTDSPATAGSTKVTKDPGSGVAIVGNSGLIPNSSSYTVRAGDAGWSNLASRAYGDYRWWPALWDANRSGTKFQNPDLIRAGDVVVIPSLPVTDEKFKAAVFARAEADRAWALAKAKAKKAGRSFKTPRPAIVSSPTPTSTNLLTPGEPVPVNATPTTSSAPLPTSTSTATTTAPLTVVPTEPSTEEEMGDLADQLKQTLHNN